MIRKNPEIFFDNFEMFQSKKRCSKNTFHRLLAHEYEPANN